MRFGSYLSAGPLYEEADQNGGTGGTGGASTSGGQTPVIDIAALEKMINTTIASQFEARDRAAKAEAEKQAKAAADRKLAEEEAARKTTEEEAERKRVAAGDKTPEDKELSQQMAKLRKELEDEKNRRQKTEQLAHQRDIQARLLAALERDDYAKASAKQLAYKAIADQIKEDETGSLVGPGGMPLKEYIDKMFATDLDTLLAPKKTGGSGATGAAAGTTTAPTKVNIDDIKPGSQDLDKARAEISALLKQQRG